MTDMDAVAIIPARGGSKRIPGKNLRPFAGRPIIAYSIAAALGCGCFRRVVVSTDDEAIARVSREHGAETPFMRPAALAGDHVPTSPVLAHALGELEKASGLPELFCCLYPTAPFVTAGDLARGRAELLEHDAVTAISVAAYPAPIFRALEIRDGFLRMIWPEHRDTRSQDLPTVYQDAGQFYWGQTRRFLREGELYAGRSVPVVLPRHRVCDLDTEEDWLTAELLFEAWSRRGGV